MIYYPLITRYQHNKLNQSEIILEWLSPLPPRIHCLRQQPSRTLLARDQLSTFPFNPFIISSSACDT